MSQDPRVIRTFVAIDLPESIKQDLEKLQSLMMTETRGIRWVKPENIHLTLKFFGNVEIGRILQIERAIEKIVRNYKPFQLTPKGCGAFPSIKNIRVIWAGLEGDLNILLDLQRNLELEFESIGFPREERAFSPHLTLGRAKNITRDEKIGKSIVKAAGFQSSPFWVSEIVIFKSTLTPSGSVYNRISAIRLS